MATDDETTKFAWDSYLEATRNLTGKKYEEMEPWAWATLKSRLGMLRPKRPEKVRSIA